jgi:hypothetical protein
MTPKTEKHGIRKTSQSNPLLGDIQHKSPTVMHVQPPSTLLQDNLNPFHHLLNVLLQIANKLGL